MRPHPALAQVHEAQQGVDQVVVGAQLQRVGTCARQAFTQRGLAVGGQLGKAAAKTRVVCVHLQLLAAFGIAQRDQAHVGQLQLQRVEQAHGHHVMPLGQLGQGLFPAGRADEVGHHKHGGPAL